MRVLLGNLPRKACVAGLLMLLVTLLAFVASGCGTNGEVGDGGTVSTTQTSLAGEETTTTTAPASTTSTTASEVTTTTAASGDTLTVKVYFSKNEKIAAASRVIPKTQQVGAAAMMALLEGPTAAEKQGGMATTIPDGTTFLGLDIKDGIATVDLSKEYASGGGSLSMFMRLAEVVFTLTQFPTVDGVNFELDGQPIKVLGGEGIIIDKPLGRADYEDMSPAVLIETPTLGNTVSSPLLVTGTANVFEAVLGISIVDAAGVEVADKTVQASSGTGTRGKFDVTIDFKPSVAGTGSLIAYYNSPKDGSKVIVDTIPIVLEK